MQGYLTYIIIGVTCVVSFVGFGDRRFFDKYLYSPYAVHVHKGEWYRVFTHAFLHADTMHLLFNMFSFYFFGLALEQDIYPALFPHHAEFYYIILYVGGMMVSSFPAFEKHKNNPVYRSVGASGAVSAVIFSYILISPNASLGFMFIPIPIPASIFGILYLVYSWYMGKRGRDNIGHDAHLWGGLFGFVFTFCLKPSLLPAFFHQLMSIF
jgi:membrane associated rhomboid family serine protease